MSRIPSLIDTIMRLKRCTQAQVASAASLHRSNLSRFLAGDIDIRLSSLEAILKALNINLEEVLQREINQALGKGAQSDTLGDALEILLKRSDPITARTMLESLMARSRVKDKQSTDAMNVISSYKSKLRIVRGN